MNITLNTPHFVFIFAFVAVLMMLVVRLVKSMTAVWNIVFALSPYWSGWDGYLDSSSNGHVRLARRIVVADILEFYRNTARDAHILVVCVNRRAMAVSLWVGSCLTLNESFKLIPITTTTLTVVVGFFFTVLMGVVLWNRHMENRVQKNGQIMVDLLKS